MMARMDVSTRAEFPASPAEVFAMMTDQGYLEEVCRASDAADYHVSVDGSTTRTRRTLPAPADAARFTGPHLTIDDEVVWGPEEVDGSRTGRVSMTVSGQPVSMRGEMRLAPGGAGTTAELTGELKVAVPILGKKLEQSAAPAVLANFRTQETVGRTWLAH